MAYYYQSYKYTDNSGDEWQIRANSQTAGLQTTTAALGTAAKPHVLVNRKGKGLGGRPRYLRLRRTAGTAPNIKAYYTKLPVFLFTDVTAMKATATFDVGGVVWNNAGFVDESIR